MAHPKKLGRPGSRPVQLFGGPMSGQQLVVRSDQVRIEVLIGNGTVHRYVWAARRAKRGPSRFSYDGVHPLK